jgi:hypothetical protein
MIKSPVSQSARGSHQRRGGLEFNQTLEKILLHLFEVSILYVGKMAAKNDDQLSPVKRIFLAVTFHTLNLFLRFISAHL